MKPLPPAITVSFSDLVESVQEAAFDERFPSSGKFHALQRGDKSYWYHVMRDPAAASGRRSTYAGIVGDPAVDALVARHGGIHERHKLQKQAAALLRRAGLPAPDPIEGALALAFQKAGLFEAGAVLVGSVAYQAYGGLLGVRLGGDLHRTQDLDLAQDREIALHVEQTGQRLDDFQTILQSVDPTFTPVFNPSHHGAKPNRYVNAQAYKVDLLTSHKNSDRDRSAPISVPMLPGAALQPLDFMEFLIRNPVRSALLHEAGVAVTVPDPARYALHKAVIAQNRGISGGAGKDIKDRKQAAELLRALQHASKTSDVAQVWSELWSAKPRLQPTIARGILSLEDDAIDVIAASAIRYGEAPFSDGQAPAATLRSFIAPASPQRGKDGGKGR